MQLSECFGDATPIVCSLGWSALDVGHHDETVGEQPTVGGRDRDRHGHALAIEVQDQVSLPCKVGVTPSPETGNGELVIDAHTPHIVGDAASE